jgi:hypothetical protein
MPTEHKVRRGECLARIAFDRGFAIDTIWNHADNAALRAERKTPYVLAEGDVVVIPDKREGGASCATGRRHVFRRKGVPEVLRVQLKRFGEPRANVAYTLEIDGRSMAGTTDAEGRIEHYLMPDARAGRILIEDDVIVLQLSHLPPITADAGVRARLYNLGLLAADADDDAFAEAVRAFQRAQHLPRTGAVDEATRVALEREYGI